MFSAKFFLVSIIGLFFSSEVFASKLVCKSSSRHRYFTAIMDSSNYSNERFFDLNEANIVVGFATADNLKCAGHNLEEQISCIGHWFNQTGAILEFNIKKINDKLIGEINNLENANGQKLSIGKGLKFECEVEY